MCFGAEEKAVYSIGDDCVLYSDKEVIDAGELGFFDETEDDCWKLFIKYCDRFGIEIEDRDNADWEIAKSIQDYIISIFQDAGIKFAF